MRTQDYIRHYRSLFRQRIAFLFLGLILCAGTTLIVSAFTPPIYQSTALIKVNITTANADSDVFSAQASAVDYSLLVTSPPVLQRALQGLPGLTSNQLQQSISASPLDNTQIIEIHGQAKTPQQASNLTNMMANVFIQVQTVIEANRIQNIIDQLTPMVTSTKNALTIAQQQMTLLQARHASLQALSKQQGVVDTHQIAYNQVLVEIGQLQIQKMQADTILSILQAATPSQQPVSPQIFLNTLLSAALGLSLTILCVLIVDWLDTSIKTSTDIERICQMEPIALIPFSSTYEHTEAMGKGPEPGKNPIRDAYAILCSHLFPTIPQRARCLMVTAPGPKAGTTTSAVQLATLMAKAGKKVLLIDGNLQNPHLHHIFQIPNTQGIINGLESVWYFKNQPAQNPLIWLNRWRTIFPNLWLLPTGPSITHTETLLELTTLLHHMKDCLIGPTVDKPIVDIIIIDTPPFEKNSSALSFATVADEALLIVKAGQTAKEDLQHVYSLFEHFHMSCIGIVLNIQQKNYNAHETRISSKARKEAKKAARKQISMRKKWAKEDHKLQTIDTSIINNNLNSDSPMAPLGSELSTLANSSDRDISSQKALLLNSNVRQTSVNLPIAAPNLKKSPDDPSVSSPLRPRRQLSLTGLQPHEPGNTLFTRASAMAYQPQKDASTREKELDGRLDARREVYTPAPILLPTLKAELEQQRKLSAKVTRQLPRLQFNPLLRKERPSSKK